MNKKIVFYLVLIIFTILFFYLNYYATNQQWIFSEPNEQISGTNFGKLIAEDIIKYKKYVYTYIDGMNPSFYPLWGYPFLTLIGIKLGNYEIFLRVLQGILVVHGVYIFYKLFKIKERFFHLILFIPFLGILSIKWAGAIPAYGALLAYYLIHKSIIKKKWKYIVYVGIIAGITSNIRSEYFLLPFFFLIFVPIFKQKLEIPANKTIKAIFIIILIQFVFISPWTIRSIIISGKVRVMAANGGATIYSSLGDLPYNPWGLEGDDPDAYRYAQTHNKKGEIVEKKIADITDTPIHRYQYAPLKYRINFYPFGADGDGLLQREAAKLIWQHPYAYARRIIYNLWQLIRNGVYTNEFEKFNITVKNHKKMIAEFDSLNRKGKILYLIKALTQKEKWKFTVGFGINSFFRIVLPLLLIFFFLSTLKQDSDVKKMFYLLLPMIIYKILLISLIQYAPRHLNFPYMLLLGYFLMYIQQIRASRFTSLS